MRINGLINTYCPLIMLFLLSTATKAQDIENDFQSRTSVRLSLKPVKHLKLYLTPELRFDENFSLNKYLIEGEASYRPIDFLSLDAIYRFVGNIRETKATEYLHRYAFSATLKKELNRFEPAFRISYTNYADDDESDQYIRYKASVKYDIPKSKITPFVGTEAFQQLTDKELYKMRYIVGMDYKLFKKNYLGISYKLDYYLNEYKNRHILSIGYKIKF